MDNLLINKSVKERDQDDDNSELVSCSKKMCKVKEYQPFTRNCDPQICKCIQSFVERRLQDDQRPFTHVKYGFVFGIDVTNYVCNLR